MFNGHRQIKWEMESLLSVRLFYATIIGTITALFLNWNFFFILAAGYSVFESVVFFILVKRTELSNAELEYDSKILTPLQRMQISSHSNRYAFAYATIGLCLSFGMISFFGVLVKWIMALFLG